MLHENQQSTDGFITKQFGWAQTEPVPGDCDGDGSCRMKLCTDSCMTMIMIMVTGITQFTIRCSWGHCGATSDPRREVLFQRDVVIAESTVIMDSVAQYFSMAC